ncbi:MAG TPA: aldolase/citrate lyase family protein [Bryobacteraceae bacterium]|nr:aldolase/citrate lyase family protein [Bryobacteraceae bacterium]
MAQFGIFIELATPEPVEMAGWAGWDYCVIDCEHAPIDGAALPGMLRGARIPAYVRVPNIHAESIQGALDAGADGVIAPRVQSASEARQVAEAARFFPRGKRGVNHMVRAARYSLEPVADYLAKADERTRVIVQIETAGALAEVEQIAATPGVDELFLGPYDLSQALEIPGQVLDERLLAAGRRVLQAAHGHNRTVSVFAGNEEAARVWLEMGADAIHYSADAFLLAQAMKQARERLRTLGG